jgi:hypothetical protein
VETSGRGVRHGALEEKSAPFDKYDPRISTGFDDATTINLPILHELREIVYRKESLHLSHYPLASY